MPCFTGIGSFLFLVVRPGDPSSVLGIGSFLVAMPCFTGIGSFLFLVVRPGAPSSVLAPSSDAMFYWYW